VVSDYYSNFIEVEHFNRATMRTVSKALRIMFARYRIPDDLISDSRPQFAAHDFALFAQRWGFEHITSSPHYPQSNEKAVKRLFSKCKEKKSSECMALLDWRNTPTSGFGVESSSKVFWSSMQDHVANPRGAASSKLLHNSGCRRDQPPEAAAAALL